MKEHFLTLLRDTKTDITHFRGAASNLAALMCQEISADLQLDTCRVQTPLGNATGFCLRRKVILVPILRAGIAFLPSFLQLFCEAVVGFLGIRRDETTARPHLYYENLPLIGINDLVFLLDPMLATGGTANLALQQLKEKGATPGLTILASFIAAKPGLEVIRQHHPLVKVYTAAVDDELNNKKFIVPGLGDFGDRYFGT